MRARYVIYCWSLVPQCARPPRPNIDFLARGLLVALCSLVASEVQAAKLASVTILDQDYLVVHVLDGEVAHNESVGGDVTEVVTRYTTELSVGAAATATNWTLKSSADTNYGTAGKNPTSCYRKTKLSGQAQMDWNMGQGDYDYEYTYQHWIFLRLPSSLQQGATYTLEINSATNIGTTSANVTFDIYNSRSEAVHVNVVGYAADAPHKAADLYYWMGNGGARDYASFVGKNVYIYNVSNGQTSSVGTVSYWMARQDWDVWQYDLIGSNVWNVDFPSVATPGTYRLVVEGVGCSEDFTIANDAYANPFKVSLRGFFYMRLGQDNAANITPPPRTPLYIPGVSPTSTTVYLTTMQPYHSAWDTFSSGDVWDQPEAWAAYRKAGNPTNANATGGHADAADLDRHLGHVSIIYDMLLPYILTHGALNDDATGITESGNGVPDILDEAAYEVDFWLRLRDGDGYSHGLTNPTDSNVLYQAGTTAIAAWANAANAAMLAEAYRIVDLTGPMATYRDAAIAAYNSASGLADTMLDRTLELGYTTIRGRDLKMTAAAFLYNLTGDQTYEAVVNAESVCTSSTAEIENTNTHNQTWGTAAYLLTPQVVHFPTLQSNMRASIINEAKTQEANFIDTRPSRRATTDDPGYFHTSQNVQRTMIAHAVTDSPTDRNFFRKALALEADWGLGRNPLNIIQMTTASTPLAAKRSVEYIYTSGLDDGVPGVHPGHTPYLNLFDWDSSMVMGSPSHLYADCYPAFATPWPIAEGYFNTPWVWAHSEFTPQQTMRGKTSLYGYLYALSGSSLPTPNPTLSVRKAGFGNGTITSSPAGIDCGSTCSAAYASGTVVTLTAAAAAGSTFGGWSGACSGTGVCSVTLGAPQLVTAVFDGVCANNADCDDSNVCTTDVCDTTLATCSHTQVANCPADDPGDDPSDDPNTDPADDPSTTPTIAPVIATGCGCSARTAPSSLSVVVTVLAVALLGLRRLVHRREANRRQV